MMLILKIAILVGSLGFLLGTMDLASAAPLIMLGAALVLWWMDPEEPPRVFAWIAIGVGAAVAGMKGAPFLVALVAAPILLLAIDWWARRKGRDDPSQSSVLVAMGAVALLGWYIVSSGSRSIALGTEPRRIVAIGDSLTAGLPGESMRRWPDLLADQFGAEAVNLSYPGDTLGESMDRWGARIEGRQWHPTNPAWEPDLIVVVLGGNDIRRRAGPEGLKSDLRRWAELLKARQVPVLLVSVPGGLVTDDYAGIWREIAQEYDFAFMSDGTLRTIFTTPALTSDGIHFNAEGHARFATAVAKHIRGG